MSKDVIDRTDEVVERTAFWAGASRIGRSQDLRAIRTSYTRSP